MRMEHPAPRPPGHDDPATARPDHATDAGHRGHAVSRDHLVTGDLAARAAPAERMEMHRVTLPPGTVAGRHTHPGGVAGYVTEGRVVFELEGRPACELGAGSAFFEPPGATVLRFDNASDSLPATFVAWYPLAGDEPLLQPLPGPAAP
ncbi:cupin domain-containing protein [Streptomyces ficellus]|uniref:Cupin domain-containing protein n=1 Tax=Streptomyces ficellus TaxID=1977088 RepID=A0A6I6F1L4_9ACTN|nr:cupin domain-containing protein [Streptomyces ficellus]QGV77530.1 cupin domain-containing protein [Streptomyces ficellus]